MSWNKFKAVMKKLWYFIWEDNSIWSWMANIILAVLIIKFLVYPLLGLALGTNFPVVAVVSPSMEHNMDFESYWNAKGWFYADYNITKEEFRKFKFSNGFNKGDIMIISRAEASKTDIGDVIVFESPHPYPIIHRVVNLSYDGGRYYLTTKGDNNNGFNSYVSEKRIDEDRLYGKAFFRIPYLGYLKIFAACTIDEFIYWYQIIVGNINRDSAHSFISCLR